MLASAEQKSNDAIVISFFRASAGRHLLGIRVGRRWPLPCFVHHKSKCSHSQSVLFCALRLVRPAADALATVVKEAIAGAKIVDLCVRGDALITECAASTADEHANSGLVNHSLSRLRGYTMYLT